MFLGNAYGTVRPDGLTGSGFCGCFVFFALVAVIAVVVVLTVVRAG
jgi:hypothetical protein